MTRRIYNSFEEKTTARQEDYRAIVEELRSAPLPIENETSEEYKKRKDEAQQKLRHYMRETRIWDAVRGL